VKIYKIVKASNLSRKSSIEDFSPDVNLDQVIYFIKLDQKSIKPPDWMKKDLPDSSLIDVYRVTFFYSERDYIERDITLVLSGTSIEEVDRIFVNKIKNRIESESVKFKRTDSLEQMDEYIDLLRGSMYKGPFFVSLYLVEKRYGGPEEGGWWYTAHTYVRNLGKFDKINDAEDFREKMKKTYDDNLHDPAIYATLPEKAPPGIEEERYPEGYIPTGFSTPDSYDIIIESGAGNLDTSKNPPPHYE